ncbi:MAG: hypothetical protein CME13_14095 [Gemmatimonadetes bacterium]|jgi:MoaA/NifB/PqqE/SkfB family radical SAM enzyme|nr:hypothetical protein [Gemmatimonadota bacterium]MDP7361338.1 SPASM domain-containing protein [Candidatus Latescibacterota bacterium]HCV25139.1 hypothetical protein [Candidatus Latescibacterota bacterium]|tara:strand:- start:2043 stop:3152 length:1110 start_codon:yes stop_codon:yes gene_type:complete
MGVLKEQLYTLWANFREQGLGMAYNYTVFRAFYGVHSRPVAWLLNKYAPYPPYIEVEITTTCDLRCTMCEHTYWDEPQVMMPYEKLVSILDQFPKLRWVDFTGIGESFLHPHYIDMVSEAKRRGVYYELYDAMHRCTPDLSEELVKMGVNRIQPSIDGCTKETYENIRVRAKWEEVYANLEGLHRAKDKYNKRLPEVSYHFIIQKQNAHEMGDYVKMVRGLAQKQAVTITFTELLKEFPKIIGQKYDVSDDERAHVNEIGRSQKVNIRWNRKMQRAKTNAKKCTLWHQPFIFVDGSVIRCCTSNEHNERDRQREHALGNVFEQSFQEIWDGERYRGLRKSLREGGMYDAGCADCPTFECESKLKEMANV